MGRNRKYRGYRLLAVWLCLCLFFGTAGEAATVRDLGSVTEPAQFPAEGYIHAELYCDVEQKGEHFQYSKEEAYLPVAVSADQTVYAHLDFLAEKLDLEVSYAGQTARLDSFESSILMKLGDREYGYLNDLYQFSVEGAAAPALFQGTWYVPLDIVLNLTGCGVVYTKEDFRGKKILALVKPQRDLEDELALFYRKRSLYPFSYTQLGYSEELVEKMEDDKQIQQFLYRLGCLKPREWIYTIGCIGEIPFMLREKQGKTTWPTFQQKRTGAGKEAILEDMYLDTYMACLLQEDEAILQQTVEDTLETVDRLVAFGDIVSDANELSDGSILAGAMAAMETYTDMNSMILNNGLILENQFSGLYAPIQLLTGVLFIRYQYENSSRFEVEAARDFLERSGSLHREIVPANTNTVNRILRRQNGLPEEEMQEYLGEYQYFQIEQNVSAYEKYVTEAAVYSEYYEEHTAGFFGEALFAECRKNLDATWRYCAENGISLLYSVSDWLGNREELLGAVASKALAVVALASSVWELGGKVLFGRQIEEGESFLAGSFGVVYQKDTMDVMFTQWVITAKPMWLTL